MRIALAFALLICCADAAGAAPLDMIYCRIWPRAAACQSPTIVVPLAPAAAPASVPALAVTERVRPMPMKRVQPAKHIKSNFVKPKRRVVMPAWWSCTKARKRVAGKSQSEIEGLEAWGKMFGYTLSAEQEVIAKRCLGFA